MKIKVLSAAVAISLALAAGSASAIIVGGVDFGVQGLTNHIETTTLAETLILGDGQVLEGYGQINTVNGNLSYGVNPGDRLYFVFTNNPVNPNQYTSQNFSATNVEFTGGVIDVYLGATFNLLSQDSLSNLALIQAMTPWVSLTGHGDLGGGLPADVTLAGDGTLTGGSISFTGSGLLDVDTSGAFGIASVAAFLDSDGEPDAAGGFADIALTTSGNNSVLNEFDVCNGVAGEWCVSGSADLRGLTSIPEPSTVALLGLGLLGAGVVSRRRKEKKA